MTLDALTSYIHEFRMPPSVRRWLGVAAALLFAVGFFIALRTVPAGIIWNNLDKLLIIAVIGVPVTMFLNSIELRLSAQAAGRNMGFGSAFKLNLLSSAANMLPLPGGALVRISAITKTGASVGLSAGITLLVGLLWLGSRRCHA